MRKRYDLNDIVVYSQKKKIPNTVMQPYASPKSDLDEVVKQLEEPKPELKQLTDEDGLDRSYEAKNDLSIIDNTVYIAGTHMNRPTISLACRPSRQSIQGLHVWYEGSSIRRRSRKTSRQRRTIPINSSEGSTIAST